MRRLIGWVVVLGLLVLVNATGLWSGTGGNQAFLDSTGKLVPMVVDVPLILAPELDQNLVLQTSGDGQILANGVPLPQVLSEADTLDSVFARGHRITNPTSLTPFCVGPATAIHRCQYLAGGTWVDELLDGSDQPINQTFAVGAGRTWTWTGAGVAAMALDGTTATVNFTRAPTFTDGQKVTFNPNATSAGLNVGAQAGAPSTLINGDQWYDATANKFKCRENGATVDCIGAGGSFTTEEAQDAVGAMVDASLTYVDATPLLQRAALTGDVTATAGANATTLATKFRTLKKSISLLSPTTTESNKIQWEWPSAVTLTEVSCSTDVGTATIQLIERARATPNSGGTDSMTSDLTCSTTTATTTGFADSAIAANVPHSLEIVSVATVPTVVRIHITATVN